MPYKDGRYTFQDVGFQINHHQLNEFVIPMNKGIKWEITGDGAFAHKDSPGVITNNGKILGSK